MPDIKDKEPLNKLKKLRILNHDLNREGWLTVIAKKIELVFSGYKINPYKVTCGWPCVRSLSSNGVRVGECHSSKSSVAGLFEIFISPLVDKSSEVAGILAHELAHVVAGTEARHGKDFVKVCKHAGLTEGKPISVMPGPFLADHINQLIKEVGDYPHSALIPSLGKVKKDNKGRVNLECECGCKVSISKKWINEVGFPTCGCGKLFRDLD